MDATDRVIRALYVLALDLEQEWERYRPMALEQVCRALGIASAGWLTQVGDRSRAGEFTTYPESGGVDAAVLQALAFNSQTTVTLGRGAALPGTRHGLGILYAHHDSRLVSVVAFGFESATPAHSAADLRRVAAHLAEASALALRHYIQRDERLYRMGRTNRGATAVVDDGGTLYAASRRFRELLGEKLGRADLDQLPFALPPEAFTDTGLFSHGELRFRAARLSGGLYQLYARQSQPLDELSPREQEIARALGAGKTFKSVARQCGIAVSTVANHASRIYRKLGVYRREDLVQLVRSRGRR